MCNFNLFSSRVSGTYSFFGILPWQMRACVCVGLRQNYWNSCSNDFVLMKFFVAIAQCSTGVICCVFGAASIRCQQNRSRALNKRIHTAHSAWFCYKTFWLTLSTTYHTHTHTAAVQFRKLLTDWDCIVSSKIGFYFSFVPFSVVSPSRDPRHFSVGRACDMCQSNGAHFCRLREKTLIHFVFGVGLGIP